MDFLKEHETILLALLPVLAGFGGAWLGAKVQAAGGMAQAKAAEEAARTAATATLQAVREQTDLAATATHAAALRDQQTGAITDLLRAVREFTRAVDQLYTAPGTEAIESAYNDLFHAQGAVELVAPVALNDACARVLESAQRLARLARDRAEAERAKRHMHSIFSPDSVGLLEAQGALDSYRAACLTGDDDSVQVDLFHTAESTLSRVPDLTSLEQAELVLDCLLPELAPELAQHRHEHSEAMTAFIEQARVLLGINN